MPRQRFAPRAALLAITLLACAPPPASPSPLDQPAAPPELLGRFQDDYGNHYRVTATDWVQLPHGRFHIAAWWPDEQYLIAQNDATNSYAPGLWTRIDWMRFDGMAPYIWGYCLTAYEAPSASAAAATPAPDRATPLTGCNGYPFSRLRREAEDSV
ncbi:MAG: hypothetical protein ABI587_07175 [Gemmatimonadales bacterium]